MFSFTFFEKNPTGNILITVRGILELHLTGIFDTAQSKKVEVVNST